MAKRNESKTRILVVEDNPTTSKTLALFLVAEGYQVTSVCNGREGLSSFRRTDFDLMILDLMLPDLDGLTICHCIREYSDAPIVMLTAKTSEDDIVEGLEAGADDYVCKPFGARELLARVRRCLRDSAVNKRRQETLKVGEIVLDTASRSVLVKGTKIRVTRSEFDILALLMAKPGRVFTRDQIIQSALGTDFDGLDRTVDTHVWSLRRKLGEPKGAPRYILSELGIGYRMADHDEK